ncbi:site-specific recombinase XerD [Clostridium beijerinckii]|uniref:Site-specific recombinase XerD n=1 Tax=Clostridium beijerinckii TaxID=1520 RepID=A0AAX0B2G6_CLOBE|nr:site-specific recombinase XerD [Clostridium beijerinckii]NYC74378.1 site-specific recombinase XerD [Clostridium beijerinckii]
MRAFELLQLTIYDIHSDEVMIIGKGNKSRMVLIPESQKNI